MDNEFKRDNLNDIAIDNAMKRKYAALMYKHQLSYECRNAGFPLAAYKAAIELLEQHFPFPMTHTGHATYLSNRLQNDRDVLAYYLNIEASAIRGDTLPTIEQVALVLCEILDKISMLLNEFPNKTNLHKKLKELRVTAFEASQLFNAMMA